MGSPRADKQQKALVYIQRVIAHQHGQKLLSGNARPTAPASAPTLAHKTERMHNWQLRMERLFGGQAY